jgi:hypothetical protein
MQGFWPGAGVDPGIPVVFRVQTGLEFLHHAAEKSMVSKMSIAAGKLLQWYQFYMLWKLPDFFFAFSLYGIQQTLAWFHFATREPPVILIPCIVAQKVKIPLGV